MPKQLRFKEVFIKSTAVDYNKFVIRTPRVVVQRFGNQLFTGSFMHSNTSKEVLETAGELIARGAEQKKITKALFHTTPVSQLKLWGRILARAHVNDKGAVVSAVTEQDLEECNSKPEETTGAIDYLNAVEGSRLSILLAEDRKGNIKGSMRTQRDDIDLTRLAGLFGGGGHKKASGFTLPGKLRPETIWRVTM